MNPDPVPLATRSRSVTVIAVTFGLLAGFFGVLSVIPLSSFALHHHTILLWKGMLALGLAMMHAAIAAGLWRLSPTFRILALIVAALNTLAEGAVIGFAPGVWPPLDAANIAEWLGCLLGSFLVLCFLGSPIFVLTRPRVVEAFRIAGVARK